MLYRPKVMAAHRAAWILYKGEIPAGIFVCHTCDNRRCCNPAHLFLGTQKDNLQDMKRKGRSHMPPKERRDRMAERFAIPFRLIDPHGVLHEVEETSSKFCTANMDCVRAGIWQIRHGIFPQYKGWRIAPKARHLLRGCLRNLVVDAQWMFLCLRDMHGASQRIEIAGVQSKRGRRKSRDIERRG